MPVTTLAGGTQSFADGAGTSASFSTPLGVAISPDGGFALVADANNHRVRRIGLATGAVTTLAGSDSSTFADGTGTAAGMNYPFGIAISNDGVFALVTENSGRRVRRIVIATGVVTVLAGSLTATAATVDGTGTQASFNVPRAMAISPDSSVALVAEYSGHVVRHIAIVTGTVTTLAGSGTGAFADGMGTQASFNSPTGLVISPDGAIALVVDNRNFRVRRIVIATGLVSTLAGSGSAGAQDGIGTQASFANPNGAAISPDGTFALVCETSLNRVRRIVIASGSVTSLAGSGTAAFADGSGISASFSGLIGIAISPDSSFALIADQNNHRVRRIALTSPCKAGYFCARGAFSARGNIGSQGTVSRSV